MAAQVYVCKVLKCWNPDQSRMELSTRAGSTAAAAEAAIIAFAVEKWKGQIKKGQAPRGTLERKLDAWLQTVQGGKGKGKGKEFDWEGSLHSILIGRGDSNE